MTFRLNGTDCPCVRFPASAEWREGVRLTLSGLPDPGDDTQRVVVSCATPPVPPSLLEAAANPLTGAEHVAAGSMEYDADVYDSGGEYDFDESGDEDESDDGEHDPVAVPTAATAAQIGSPPTSASSRPCVDAACSQS